MITAAQRNPSSIDAIEENARLYAEIDALRLQIAELELLADTDTLVALGNRRAFERAVARSIAGMTRRGPVPAILFVDFNGLKRVNDCHGHRAGDLLLQHVASALVAAEPRAVVARIGGDEFGMIVQALDIADAQRRARDIETAVAAAPFIIAAGTPNATEIACSITIGVALVERRDSCESVIGRADAAMYAQRSARK